MIKEFGFQKARYLRDWYHLFNSGLSDIFGEMGNTLIKGDLVQMIKADSEEHFEKAYSNAQLILRQQQPRNADLEATLDILQMSRQNILNLKSTKWQDHGDCMDHPYLNKTIRVHYVISTMATPKIINTARSL